MSGTASKHSRTSSSEFDCVDIRQLVDLFDICELVEPFGVAVVDLFVTDLLGIMSLCCAVVNLFGVVDDLFGVEGVFIRGLTPGLEPFAILPPDMGG